MILRQFRAVDGQTGAVTRAQFRTAIERLIDAGVPEAVRLTQGVVGGR